MITWISWLTCVNSIKIDEAKGLFLGYLEMSCGVLDAPDGNDLDGDNYAVSGDARPLASSPEGEQALTQRD